MMNGTTRSLATVVTLALVFRRVTTKPLTFSTSTRRRFGWSAPPMPWGSPPNEPNRLIRSFTLQLDQTRTGP